MIIQISHQSFVYACVFRFTEAEEDAPANAITETKSWAMPIR